MPARKRRAPEASTHKAVIALLNYSADPARVMFFHCRNEGRRSPAECASLKPMGLKTGLADIEVIIDGRAHFLELKAKDGRMSKAQREFFLECETLGIPYALARSFDEARTILASWGAFRRRQDMRRAA